MKRILIALLLLPRLVLAACTSTDSYSTIICGDGPIHYYRLSETTSTYADSVTTGSIVGTDDGAGNHRGATGITCCSNLAVRMDGGSSSSGVTYSTSNDFAINSTLNAGFSAEVWAFPTTSTANFIFTRAESNPNFQYSVTQQASNTVDAVAFTCVGGSYADTTNQSGLVQNQWNHIVMTTLGAGGGALTHLRLYVNGVLKSTVTSFSGTFCSTSGAHASTGRRDDIPQTVTFTGTMDEQAYYAFELSQAQVTAHFNAGLASHADWPYTVKNELNRLTFGPKIDLALIGRGH